MLILDDPNTWPEHIFRQLKKRSVIKLLKQHKSFDSIRYELDIQDICVDVKEYAESAGMAAYHCTKQVPEHPYIKTGLRVLCLEVHHKELLETMRHYRPDLGEDYWERVKDILAEWRVVGETGEGRLNFCPTQSLVVDDNDGTEKFFRYFGGEAGYMPFIYGLYPDVEKVLEHIGEPVVVEVRLHPSDLGNFYQDTAGPTLVSYFAHSINPGFLAEDFLTQIRRNVEPCDVTHVYPYAEFVDMVMTRRKTE